MLQTEHAGKMRKWQQLRKQNLDISVIFIIQRQIVDYAKLRSHIEWSLTENVRPSVCRTTIQKLTNKFHLRVTPKKREQFRVLEWPSQSLKERKPNKMLYIKHSAHAAWKPSK